MEYIQAKENYLNAQKIEAEKVMAFIKQNGVRKSAKLLKLSPAYICDIKHGRRAVSDNVIDNLLGVA